MLTADETDCRGVSSAKLLREGLFARRKSRAKPDLPGKKLGL